MVTLNGILIHKSGLMTGGITQALEKRASMWDEKKIEGNSFIIIKQLIFFY